MDASLGQLFLIAVIVLVLVPAPLFIILQFITKWRQSREISTGDEQMLDDLWQLSQRMEERIESLETILENEVPSVEKKI